MDITMTREEFDLLLNTMALANRPYTNEEAEDLILGEEKCYKTLLAVAERHDLQIAPQR